MLTGGSAGRDDSSVEAGLGDDVDLNGWIPSRVIDRTSFDFEDRHGGFLKSR